MHIHQYTDSYIAMSRFGLGPSQSDLDAINHEPKGWVLRQINQASLFIRDIPSSASELVTTQSMRRMARGQNEAEQEKARRRQRSYIRIAARSELGELTTTTHPFTERLVAFWANHFTVSGTKATIRRAIPAYINEAIRPHIYGRFEDMLQAVVAHPAMLLYLDNSSSIGPNSRQGERRSKGLNENLAREVLELHTLGSRGGYSQEDVTTFAEILTGWGVQRRQAIGETASAGTLCFFTNRHEPGPKTLLDRTYEQTGRMQGVAALRDIAAHPSTATHIAQKLVAHFIADDAPKDVIEQLARVFQETDGDLKAVYTALVNNPQAWSVPLSKVRSPYEFIVASLRLTADPAETRTLQRRLFETTLTALAQPLNRPPSPKGWPDTPSDWITPAALMRRLEWTQAITRERNFGLSPIALYDLIAGPAADPDTRRLIAGAPSQAQGQALALSSPAFQRR